MIKSIAYFLIILFIFQQLQWQISQNDPPPPQKKNDLLVSANFIFLYKLNNTKTLKNVKDDT